ncbi:uncharacterized protein LOC132048713 [Lycium ferocissimum]|uniref:uncharacterized protein LOC132048713 n=1 Tax=Lycium ferocissimum TaxID=112874 RepID=UPI002816539B|nr:uncharacterized protein LOC132048713 [Lycium ferocissimum]
MMLDLDNQAQSILTCFDKQKEETKSKYRVRLNASIDVARFLLKEGMSFRGHDESETSARRENFLDLLKWYADKNEDAKQVVLENAPQNDIRICPIIQKDIVSSCAKETNKAIEDLNGDYFGILVDESKDVSHKEQMALILRYVNKEGKLIERFLSVVHVKDTSAWSLQDAIYSLLLEHNLSSSQIRGQGYDGASNMQREINGLKTLIMKDSPSAYCTHCFAHQLQLTLVAVAKKHHEVDQFFDILANVLNVIGGSFKRRAMLRDDQAEKLKELLVLGEVHTGSGLHQELGLQRARDTLLAITHDLNMALQRKDQDIVSAMNLVGFTKRQLQSMRESKWDSLVKDVSSFCVKHDIVIPEMDKNYALGKSKQLNNHFDEVNTDLLLGMASLSPDNSFANYDKERIMKLATHYRDEFSVSMLEDLSFKLDNYIDYV